MLDKLLVSIAFVGFMVFCGIVVVFVRIPDLAITIGLILFIAGYDFWISVLRPGAASEPPRMQTGLEASHTAVSGRVANPTDN